MEPIKSILTRVLEDLGLPEMATDLRRANMEPIKGGQRKEPPGMVVTSLEQVPDEAA